MIAEIFSETGLIVMAVVLLLLFVYSVVKQHTAHWDRVEQCINKIGVWFCGVFFLVFVYVILPECLEDIQEMAYVYFQSSSLIIHVFIV